MNLKVKKPSYWLLIFFVAASVVGSCKKDNNNPNPTDVKNEQSKNYVKAIMQEWYYWYDKIPNVDISKISTPAAVLDTLLYKEYDKWSFIGDSAEIAALLESGEVKSYGYFLAQSPLDYNIYVTYVYNNSPMGLAGVKRGYQLTKIGGVAVMDLIRNNTIYDQLNKESNSFTFIGTDGLTQTLNVTMGVFTINTVLYKSVVSLNNKNVGYLVFNSFVGAATTELDNAFAEFKAAGVKDVILDLRYNGGGENEVCEHLAGLLIPASKDNSVLYSIKYNQKKLSYGQTVKVHRQTNALDVDNLLVITSDMTASASELLINSLKPYLNVKLVGSKTDGKPVGMNGFSFNGYLMFPITFKTVNSLGEGDYFGGFNPDYEAMDNITEPFGSNVEDSYISALYYCQHGYFPAVVKKATINKVKPIAPLKGLQTFSRCY